MSADMDEHEWATGFCAGVHGDDGRGHTPLWRDGYTTGAKYARNHAREARGDHELLRRNSLLPTDAPEAPL